MKNIFTLAMVMLLPYLSFSQRNYQKFSFGVGGGATANKGDLSQSQSKNLFTANLDYYFSPYIQSGLEFQTGKIYGNETGSRFYQNHFKSYIWINKVHLGQFMKQRGFPIGTQAIISNSLKGIFAGAGLGVIQCNQKKVFREEQDISTYGSNKNMDAIIPLTIGIDNSAFNQRWITGIAYQGHFAMSDQLDGYSPAGSKRDYYSTVVISFKYRFGGLGIY